MSIKYITCVTKWNEIDQYQLNTTLKSFLKKIKSWMLGPHQNPIYFA